MTYAYDELYLHTSQRILGDMYDFAVNVLKITLEEFQKMFLVSDISKQFAKGNPMYIAGKNGCEVAREVVEECTGNHMEEEDLMYIDKSPEYWLGWSLAYYQWKSDLSFTMIEEICPIMEMYRMYEIYHEMDVTSFVATIEERRRDTFEVARLKRLRKYSELTQRELAKQSEVPLRQIQLFEQGYRDIRKCQVQQLAKIAKVLNCSVEDLWD